VRLALAGPTANNLLAAAGDIHPELVAVFRKNRLGTRDK
jgi:hypothetical protein